MLIKKSSVNWSKHLLNKTNYELFNKKVGMWYKYFDGCLEINLTLKIYNHSFESV